MKAKIAKWGNSLAVRLPKAVVDEAGLKPTQKWTSLFKAGTCA
jgi:antitoxin component of MazEF toxin-antitoxin module